jgi:DNA-binding transcriptional regulator/RsmH inhibitor MraZ
MGASQLRARKRRYSIPFFGIYEVTVLSDRRIILPAGVMRQFKDRGIEEVLSGKYPARKALILCPETLWSKWCDGLKRKFPCLRTHDGAKTFLIPWQPSNWDSKGRMSLPRQARDYAGIKANDTVILIGMNYYFELWAEEEFARITRECEIALAESV